MYFSCINSFSILFIWILLSSYLVTKVQDVVILPNDLIVHAKLTLQATNLAIKVHYDIAVNYHPHSIQIQLQEYSEKVLEQLD